jgi:hypothetical protein
MVIEYVRIIRDIHLKCYKFTISLLLKAYCGSTNIKALQCNGVVTRTTKSESTYFTRNFILLRYIKSRAEGSGL